MLLSDTAVPLKLPVSGVEVVFRAPDGNDDLAVLESHGEVVRKGVVALERLAHRASDGSAALPWRALTVTDFETALLGLRRYLFGDLVACTFTCPTDGCGERLAPDFSIAAFLEEIEPALPRHIRRDENHAGWFALEDAGNGLEFRLPLVEDQLAVLGQTNAETSLAERCMNGRRLNARNRQRVERAMEALAPLVSRPLEGQCPQCGERLNMPVHVPRLVIDELSRSAATLHEEIHLIAQNYHWPESAILSLPQSRRRAYAETIRNHARAGTA